VRRSAALIVALATLAPFSPVRAQLVADNGRTFYEAAFFAPYSPANALQIVERVPGFTLDKGDTTVRGFSQAAGNVVINGQRPSAKTETLETVLARIPASRVQRVELASGEQFGSDYAGKPQVVNIVMTEAGGVAGNIEATLRREFTGAILPEGSLSALIRTGASTFNVSASLANADLSDTGYDLVKDLRTGQQTELRLKRNRFKKPAPRVAASWALEQEQFRSAHFNGSFALAWPLVRQKGLVLFPSGATRDDTIYQGFFDRTLEFGGDVTRPLAGGGIKLLGLFTNVYHDRTQESLLGVTLTPTGGGQTQNSKEWREERVARVSWSRPDLGGWSAELGVEGAFNRLKSLVKYESIDGFGARTRINLPIDDAIVSEYRGEAFANLGRDLSRSLHLDVAVNYEASRLTVTGDVQARRSLQFLKPKVTLDWRSGVWHAQIGAKRTVAQLNFGDFISNADISNGRINGGNANLLPQRAWEFLVSIDRPILGNGRVKLDLGYNAVSKVQDRIRIVDPGPPVRVFDAPGNIDSGAEYIVRGNIDLPLGGMGIKGGRLSLYGAYVKTSLTDPYTGRKRPFSNQALFDFTANFRQDLGQFAWGFGLEGDTGATAFRLNEEDETKSIMPYASVFAEYRPTAAWTMTLGAKNLTDRGVIRHRDFFQPDRTTLVPTLYEKRDRNPHILFYVTVKRSFG
jgi:hypothetical protein